MGRGGGLRLSKAQKSAATPTHPPLANDVGMRSLGTKFIDNQSQVRSDSGHRDLRSACSKAAVATKRSAGSYVSNHSSKWAAAIDHQLSIASGANLAAPDPLLTQPPIKW